jgi:YesN/AraC family two-component response regulator
MKNTITLQNRYAFILSEDQKVAIKQQLATVFEAQKSYLEPQFSLDDLSLETHLSTNLLCAFFNNVLGIHFTSYINGLRIQYFKETLDQETALHFTLEALARQCGFHNANIFITVFKKVEGITPSDYINLYLESLQLKRAV